MKKLPLLLSLAVALCWSLSALAQAKMTKGDVSGLSKGGELNVEFTYENMGVGKFKDEKDYLDKKRDEYNKKEAGRGDRWVESWNADRGNRFEPAFNDLFSKNSGMNAGDRPKAQYTLIVNTDFTEPGFNVGVIRKNAYIDGTAKLVETNNRSKVVAEFTFKKMPGRDFSGYDFDTGERIEEAYAKTGKELGQLVKKKMKK